jgi:hypothetical protein
MGTAKLGKAWFGEGGSVATIPPLVSAKDADLTTIGRDKEQCLRPVGGPCVIPSGWQAGKNSEFVPGRR